MYLNHDCFVKIICIFNYEWQIKKKKNGIKISAKSASAIFTMHPNTLKVTQVFWPQALPFSTIYILSD